MRNSRELATREEEFQQRKAGEQPGRNIVVQTDHHLPQFCVGT
jgi:hypothetical protein